MSTSNNVINHADAGTDDRNSEIKAKLFIREFILKVYYNAEYSTRTVHTLTVHELENDARELLDLFGKIPPKRRFQILADSVLIPVLDLMPSPKTAVGNWKSVQDDGLYRGVVEVARLLITCFVGTVALEDHDTLSEDDVNEGLRRIFEDLTEPDLSEYAGDSTMPYHPFFNTHLYYKARHYSNARRYYKAQILALHLFPITNNDCFLDAMLKAFETDCWTFKYPDSFEFHCYLAVASLWFTSRHARTIVKSIVSGQTMHDEYPRGPMCRRAPKLDMEQWNWWQMEFLYRARQIGEDEYLKVARKLVERLEET